MNIKQKLTWAFASIACLPVVIATAVIIVNLRGQAQEDFIDNSTREIRQIDNAMNLFFDGIAQNVEYLANMPQITDLTDLKNYSSAGAAQQPLPASNQAVLKLFTSFASSHPTTAFLSKGQVDGGYATWPDVPDMANYDPRVRPWYKTAMASPGKTVRSAAYYWAGTNVTLMATARTVSNTQGAPVGVLSLDVSLNDLTDMVKRIKLGQSGYLMLVEANGNVLVDPSNAEHNFKSMSELGSSYAELANAKQSLVQVELDGVSYMANVWSSEKLGWRFIGLIQRDEVMSKATHLAWLIAGIAAVLVLIFAVVGASVAGLIVRPIRSVAGGLESIAQGEGDLTRSLEVRGQDETAILARWFNQFLGAIRQLVQSIGSASGELQKASDKTIEVAHDMNNAAGRQREAVELVSTAFNEMVATANEVARSCNAAATSANAGHSQVHDGQLRIDEATGSVASSVRTC